MHEFISSGCENHPTYMKRILARKIVLNILYINFMEIPSPMHHLFYMHRQKDEILLTYCRAVDNHTSSSAEYILQ